MKKIIIALLAAAAVGPIAATSAEAQDHRPDRHGPTDRGPAANGPGRPGPDHGPMARPNPGRPAFDNRPVVRNESNFRRWNKGQRFDRRYAQNYQEINDWRAYRGRRLYAPPRGYHWVRSGNDAVLVAVAGGLIGAVLGGAFN